MNFSANKFEVDINARGLVIPSAPGVGNYLEGIVKSHNITTGGASNANQVVHRRVTVTTPGKVLDLNDFSYDGEGTAYKNSDNVDTDLLKVWVVVLSMPLAYAFFPTVEATFNDMPLGYHTKLYLFGDKSSAFLVFPEGADLDATSSITLTDITGNGDVALDVLVLGRDEIL